MGRDHAPPQSFPQGHVSQRFPSVVFKDKKLPGRAAVCAFEYRRLKLDSIPLPPRLRKHRVFNFPAVSTNHEKGFSVGTTCYGSDVTVGEDRVSGGFVNILLCVCFLRPAVNPLRVEGEGREREHRCYQGYAGSLGHGRRKVNRTAVEGNRCSDAQPLVNLAGWGLFPRRLSLLSWVYLNPLRHGCALFGDFTF